MTRTRTMQAQARRILGVTVAAFSVAGAAVAQAQTTMPAAKPADATAQAAFKRADANSDGKLSPSEAVALPAIAARFEALDTDKDGMLSSTEFALGYQAPAK
ncbi:hypothetical protein [uncultured Methylibium sp.]|uniref:hypothetical protein n=1 Tax=uncultured Methylibium sp. TaxID=381093 RepID=UPI0025DE88CC|nr:hypothetical protein [uncultured Methylibium sp.]